MTIKHLGLAVALGVAMSVAGEIKASFAEDQQRDRDQVHRDSDRGPVYGSQLMTEQERAEYRSRMRAVQTEQERERIRAEHHERMKERARQRGLALPDEPLAGRGHRMDPPHGGGRRR